MKESLQCPKCESRKIGHFESLPDYSGKLGMALRILSAFREGSFWKGDLKTTTARVEAYVCTSCGYFEEYVPEPESIPWDKMPGFRWCRPEVPEAPFR